MLMRRLAAAGLVSAFFPVTSNAVNLTSSGAGEVAIAPYYTVRDGWQTLVSLTNTQNVPVVVKVRFHESTNSRDVLDFNIALAAFDMFNGVVREASDGSGPVFIVKDSPDNEGRITCTIPGAVALSGNGRSVPYVNNASVSGNLNTSGVPLSTLAFTANDALGTNMDGGPETVDRLREGYIEFIVLGYTEAGTVDLTNDDVNDDGVRDSDGVIDVAAAIDNHRCNLLDRAFSSSTNNLASERYILQTARQFGEPINAIKFNFSLLNPTRGVEAGSEALTWANFYNPVRELFDPNVDLFPQYLDKQVLAGDEAACQVTRGDERGTSAGTAGAEWQPDGANGSCRNLITAQTPYSFLEPTLNDAYPAIAQWWDDKANIGAALSPTNTNGLGGVENLRGVDAVSLTIQRSAIYNDFSTNPALGVQSSWIVTMPTKSFYVDDGLPGTSAGHQVAILAGERDEAVLRSGVIGDPTTTELPAPYPPFANEFGGSDPDALTASACNQVNYQIFDRASQTDQPAAVDEGLSLELAFLPGELSSMLDIPLSAVDGLINAIFGALDSPTPQAPDFLCHEANVITFDGESGPLSPANPTNIDIDSDALSGNTSGWMFMSLNNDDAANSGGTTVGGIPARLFADPETALTPNLTLEGLPVIGMTIKQRSFGSVTRNFASTTQHGYSRCPVLLDPTTGQPIADLIPSCSVQ